jgi:transposase
LKHYSEATMERAMKIQEIILRAIGKRITWLQAAEIIGISARQMRRIKERYEEYGYDGLYDRRKGKPSPRRVPLETVEKVLGLYREEYFDFNVKHYWEKLKEEHGIELSYTWVKTALQGAGLVKKERKRRTHRKRRVRRPLTGMLLHIDGSKHQWFEDQRWYDLIVIMDDATSEIYYAQLVEEESTQTVMKAIREVVESKGRFCSLYSDRASHFFHTPKAGEAVDRERMTQVGRALKQLEIEPIPAYSPQARGRSERGFRTWQGRLPQELRIRKIATMEAANDFLRQEYIREWNNKFTVKSTEKGTAFVPCKRRDLDFVFSIQHERVVANDNTVSYANRSLQIEPTKWRRTLAGCRVTIHQHLDGRLSVAYGPHAVGCYTAEGVLIGKQPVPRKVRAA